MAREIYKTQATPEQVPDVGFYLRTPGPEGEVAIKKLQESPEAYHIFEFWSLNRGEYFVPMIGVLVDDVMVNLDRRSGLGKEIYDRFQKAWEKNK